MSSNNGGSRIINPYDRTPKGAEMFRAKVEEFSAKIKAVEATWTEQAVRALCPKTILWTMDRGLKGPAKWYFKRRSFHIMHKDDGTGGKWIIVWKDDEIQRIGHSYIKQNQYLMQEATEDERAKITAETMGQGTETPEGTPA